MDPAPKWDQSQCIASKRKHPVTAYAKVDGMESDSNHVMSEIEGFEYPSREICKTVVGWHAQLAEMAGGKGVEFIHESCVMNGADVCRYVVRWKL